MKRIKFKIGVLLMIAAVLISERAEMFLIYGISAALHECGHMAAARLLKIEIKEIRFDFSGVRICTEDKITSYRKEFLLAAAGPMVNFFAVTAVVLCFSVKGISIYTASWLCECFLLEGRVTSVGALGFFALSSILQGGINLLPVRTFDGGRMAYCIAAHFSSSDMAERLLDIFSAFSAFLLWTVALYLMLRISSGLGIYAFSACLFLSTIKKEPE